VQAHALGEVGILGIVLLGVYSGTLLPIFIEIGSYLADKEQKISWHSFFETRCIYCVACSHSSRTLQPCGWFSSDYQHLSWGMDPRWYSYIQQ